MSRFYCSGAEGAVNEGTVNVNDDARALSARVGTGGAR